jgi:hypothetical protein
MKMALIFLISILHSIFVDLVIKQYMRVYIYTFQKGGDLSVAGIGNRDSYQIAHSW